MVSGYATKAKVGILVAIASWISAWAIVTHGTKIDGDFTALSAVFCIGGIILWFYGCHKWAEGKGYSGAFGLLGLFLFLGLIVLAFLPDRHKQTSKVKCANCGSNFYQPKTMSEKTDFSAMQHVRVGCSKCGTPVCFSCATTAANKKGKSMECFCPKCGAELGRGGEAGQLGDSYRGWDTPHKRDMNRKQKKPASVVKQKKAMPVDNAIAKLSGASHKERVGIAIELLKSSDSGVRAAVASEVARLEIKAVGVWYELANALADEHEPVRKASAKTFWKLDGVSYAIRSLRDEHENPAHMSKESALRGIRTLMEAAPEKTVFITLLKNNWQDCPQLAELDTEAATVPSKNGERRVLKRPRPKTSKEKAEEKNIECADCHRNFSWDDAYKCQDTLGAALHTLYNNDYMPRAFCPHCGALVIQWHITKEKDFDEWAWFGENRQINAKCPFPDSPMVYGWGINVPAQLVPKWNQNRLNIEKIKQQTAISSAEPDTEIAKGLNLVSKYGDVRTMSLESALFIAAQHGINEAVGILLHAGANPNYKAPSGWTPLLMAASNGHAEAVRMLLQKDADPNDQDVFAAHTPLILASKNKHIDVVKILLEAGADVNRQNQWGHSVLGWAKGNEELEKIFGEVKGEEKVLKLVASYPYANSLTASPDNKDVAWISHWEKEKFRTVVFSPTEQSPRLELEYPIHRKMPGYTSIMRHVLFVAGGRLLVALPLQDSSARLVLLDAESGKELTSKDVPDFKFYSLCINNAGDTIAAEKDTESLLVVSIAGDKLTHREVRTGSTYGPTPYFAPNGKLYALHYRTFFSIEGDQVVNVAHTNEANSVAFDLNGKVYFGGGFSDRSGEANLQVVDLDSGESFEIPLGREPIEVIEPAGDDKVLLGNKVLSLFRVSERKKEWSVELAGIPAYHSPVLLSVPEEGWALLQSGQVLKRVSLDNGEVLEELPKGMGEFLQARWLGSDRMLCVSRNRSRDTAGKIEFYKIE